MYTRVPKPAGLHACYAALYNIFKHEYIESIEQYPAPRPTANEFALLVSKIPKRVQHSNATRGW